MKIYFAGSIRGGRDDQALYQEIITMLAKYGQVLTEHVGTVDLGIDQGVTDKYIFTRDMAWLTESDVVVAEVTNPSLGVGYELGMTEKLGKKVLCLFRPSSGKRLSAMLTGNDKLLIHQYSEVASLQDYFDNFFDNNQV